MTPSVIVERIDILDGPNLKSLLEGFRFATRREELNFAINLKFNEVVFIDESGVEIQELGRLYTPILAGIRYLGYEPKPDTRDDFVITVRSGMGTFEGHYNTHSRKGMLLRVK